ncbi:winged helix-turn-helix transcriptional regulator [Streptomyces bobili]|uniref:winged helix-turn-helix transcriptional regulator n=1 Tax=Streptomyces bobili TaxID=67280 RepID=UPI0033C97356
MQRTLALTAAELARRVNLSASATRERVRRPEEAEVIQGDGPPDLGIADLPVLRSAEDSVLDTAAFGGVDLGKPHGVLFGRPRGWTGIAATPKVRVPDQQRRPITHEVPDTLHPKGTVDCLRAAFVVEGLLPARDERLGRPGTPAVACWLITSPGRARPRRDRPGIAAGRSCRARLATPSRRPRSPW